MPGVTCSVKRNDKQCWPEGRNRLLTVLLPLERETLAMGQKIEPA